MLHSPLSKNVLHSPLPTRSEPEDPAAVELLQSLLVELTHVIPFIQSNKHKAVSSPPVAPPLQQYAVARYTHLILNTTVDFSNPIEILDMLPPVCPHVPGICPDCRVAADMLSEEFYSVLCPHPEVPERALPSLLTPPLELLRQHRVSLAWLMEPVELLSSAAIPSRAAETFMRPSRFFDPPLSAHPRGPSHFTTSHASFPFPGDDTPAVSTFYQSPPAHAQLPCPLTLLSELPLAPLASALAVLVDRVLQQVPVLALARPRDESYSHTHALTHMPPPLLSSTSVRAMPQSPFAAHASRGLATATEGAGSSLALNVPAATSAVLVELLRLLERVHNSGDGARAGDSPVSRSRRPSRSSSRSRLTVSALGLNDVGDSARAYATLALLWLVHVTRVVAALAVQASPAQGHAERHTRALPMPDGLPDHSRGRGHGPHAAATSGDASSLRAGTSHLHATANAPDERPPAGPRADAVVQGRLSSGGSRAGSASAASASRDQPGEGASARSAWLATDASPDTSLGIFTRTAADELDADLPQWQRRGRDAPLSQWPWPAPPRADTPPRERRQGRLARRRAGQAGPPAVEALPGDADPLADAPPAEDAADEGFRAAPVSMQLARCAEVGRQAREWLLSHLTTGILVLLSPLVSLMLVFVYDPGALRSGWAGLYSWCLQLLPRPLSERVARQTQHGQPAAPRAEVAEVARREQLRAMGARLRQRFGVGDVGLGGAAVSAVRSGGDGVGTVGADLSSERQGVLPAGE